MNGIRLVKRVLGGIDADIIYYPANPAKWDHPGDSAEWDIVGLSFEGHQISEVRYLGLWERAEAELIAMEKAGELYHEGEEI